MSASTSTILAFINTSTANHVDYTSHIPNCYVLAFMFCGQLSPMTDILWSPLLLPSLKTERIRRAQNDVI